jgi:DNA-binding SARP family transcriptional activator
VANLRKHFSPNPVDPNRPALLTVAPGYLLRIDPARLDLLRFQKLAARGRAELAVESWDQAAVSLRHALALWRGPALADLVEDGIEWPELTAIENMRLNVLEDRVDAELAAGLHHEIVDELQMVVEAEPLRERSCRQLMVALYRCGRQAEALNAYRRTRSILVNEFGLDPSPHLQGMEHAILNHDPMLLMSAR